MTCDPAPGGKKQLYGAKTRIRILAGQYYDQESGFHYNYHRYYDPAPGRYLAPDPIGLAGGINLYAYAGLNPINAFDQFGLYESSPWLMWVPGQHMWDRSLTAFENGQYGWGSAYIAGMVGEQALFALSFGQYGAAEIGGQCVASEAAGALQPIAEAVEASGVVRNVAGYEIWANAGRVGSTYNVNVLGLYATESSQGLRALINALRSEAASAGAERISISGSAIINRGISTISDAMASRFGLSITRVNPETIILEGAIR